MGRGDAPGEWSWQPPGWGSGACGHSCPLVVREFGSGAHCAALLSLGPLQVALCLWLNWGLEWQLSSAGSWVHRLAAGALQKDLYA